MIVTDNVTFELSKVRAVLAGAAVQSTASDRQQGQQELTDLLDAAAQTLSDELTGLKRGLPAMTYAGPVDSQRTSPTLTSKS